MVSGKAFWRGNGWEVKPDQAPTSDFFDHLETINGPGYDGALVELNFTDPRQARPKQRALFFALIHDIWEWTGQPEEWLKAYFYSRYTIRTNGKSISLANGTVSTVSDATYLIDDVVDFIFTYGVPVKVGYELLPRDEEHFQWRCIRHKKCLICGRHADFHHMDAVGMGRNRDHIDHTKHRVAALCRKHHTEIHKIGVPVFLKKHHLTRIGIKVSKKTLKELKIKGDYNHGNNSSIK